MALEITKENFEELVLNAKNPVLVDFWAPWCGPCKMLGPVIDSLSDDNKDNNVTIGKVNVDENGEIAAKYGVRGIPCVLFFKDGAEVAGTRKVGLMNKAEYQTALNELS
jgi:thioredoxin 1